MFIFGTYFSDITHLDILSIIYVRPLAEPQKVEKTHSRQQGVSFS